MIDQQLIQELIARAIQVRDEQGDSQNTATRVGGLLYAIVIALAQAWQDTPDLEQLSQAFLRRDRPDTAQGPITTLQGLRSDGPLTVGQFVNSLTAGTGAGIDPQGNAQLQSLEVRTSLKVMELIINRLQAQEGEYAFTESGTIQSTQLLEPGTWLLHMRKRWDYDFTPFHEDDVIYGSINTLLQDGSTQTSWMRVLSVDQAANTLTVAVYPDADVPGGHNYTPRPSMNVTRRGNATDTSRQSCWYLSSYEGCIMFLEGVTKPILDPSNYYLTLGRPRHLDLFDGLPINYDHPYLFARGLIAQDILRVDFQGNPLYDIVDAGLWLPDAAYIRGLAPDGSRYIQHQVWYHSCLWRCVVDAATVGLPPRWNNPQWTCIQGTEAYTLEITSTAGRFLRMGSEYTTLGFILRHGTMDISVDAWQLQWSRESGLPDEDLLWNLQHAQAGHTLPITPTDMPTNWYQKRSVAFRLTVTLKPGEDTPLQTTIQFA